MHPDAKELDRFHIPEFNAYRHIRRVIRSCVTSDQVYLSLKWALSYKPMQLLHPIVRSEMVHLAQRQLKKIARKS